MILFNWGKIYRKTGGSSKRIICAIRAIISTGVPKNRFDSLYDYYYTDFSGDSYLLDPYSLIAKRFCYRPKEVAQYIALAALRNYGDYTVNKDASLDLFHSPVGEDIINSNKLLRIHKGRIYFYYEESVSRRNKLWH